MNILVINGSPKGKYSITLYTVLYLKKHFPEDNFEILDAGQQIKAFERDFSKAKEALSKADVILFSYPVYTFLVPYQLHRFIELMKENCDKDFFTGKSATQITTSKHFFDTTAQAFVNENCKDTGLCVYEGLYADMDDLTKERGRREALDFWRFFHFKYDLDNGKLEQKTDTTDKEKFRISIVANLEEGDEKLKAQIEKFEAAFPYKTQLFNVAQFKFASGCISCFKCSSKGDCVIKDGFQDILRNQINNSDAIVYAFTVKDHSMGSAFKNYDDRQFCNGHRTMTVDKPVAYLVNGDLSTENNLMTLIQARASVGHNLLVHVAEERKNEESLLAKKLTYVLENPVVQPQNFYGVGGMKIFRDLIYIMGGMMKADYAFYKKSGYFKDFPQNQKKTRLLMKLVGKLMANEKLMKKAGDSAMKEGMIGPYKKVIEQN